MVVGWLGSGGMGQVYAAYDPDLDRKVALKLVKPTIRARSEAHTRLLLEARAMAKLAHPNVVAVFDVGIHHEQIFLAMELIVGRSLRDWLHQRRYWRQVLEIFSAAGRGLAAAHDAGLVHRDFKPENVLLADDGRVCVADLGLARLSRGPRLEAPGTPSPGAWVSAEETAAEEPSPPVDTASLTQTGKVVGSPAYMAPEQSTRGQADARSDQFSFCVAFFEALYGVHPFIDSGARARAEIRRLDSAAAARVPRRLRALVERGLARDPQQRYPSMTALLSDLARTSSRRRLAPPLVLAAAMVGLGLLSWQTSNDSRGAASLATHKLEGFWDDAQKEKVRAGLAESGNPMAAETWPRLELLIDAYARRWTDNWVEAWEATHVLGEQSQDLLDRRMLCLERPRHRLAALTELLIAGDRSAVDSAEFSVMKLPDPNDCANRAMLARTVPPPAEAHARRLLGTLEQQLDRAWTLEQIGSYTAAGDVVQTRMKEIDRLAHPPLTAEAYRVLGRLDRHSGELAEATRHLEESLWAAVAGGDHEEATRAALDLFDVAHLEARTNDARRWLRLAEGFVEQMTPPPLLAAEAAVRRGAFLHDSGDFTAATAAFQQAIAILEDTYGPGHVRIAEAFNHLGALEYSRSRWHEAGERFAAAREIYVEIFGSEHPKVAQAESNLGAARRRQGRFEEAEEALERALRIRQRTYSDEHPFIGDTLNNLANVYIDRLDYGRALVLLQRAEAIFSNAFAGDHPRKAQALANIGRVLRDRGEVEEALAYMERALAMTIASRGREHLDVASMLYELSGVTVLAGDLDRAERDLAEAEAIIGHLLGAENAKIAQIVGMRASLEQRRGDYRAALALMRQASELVRKIAPENSIWLADNRQFIAATLLAAGRFEEARVAAEEALAIRSLTTPDPVLLAAHRFTLARATLATGGNRAAALDLARQARDAYLTIAGPPPLLAEIEAWLATNTVES